MLVYVAPLMAAARAASPRIGNGLCVNQKLDPWVLRGEAGTKLLCNLTRGGFAAGGMQVQYNVIDAAVLLDAKRHPERHRDLVVRISGLQRLLERPHRGDAGRHHRAHRLLAGIFMLNSA